MGSYSRPGSFDVKKIAVIGAGPCGLAAAKYLKAQKTFEEIVVFEQQDEIGGIWYYHDQAPADYPVPQEDPFLSPDQPIQPSPDTAPVFPSPMYDRLHANIPKAVMNFSDHRFREDDWIYPSREAIQRYLLEYAEDVRDLIRFKFQVKRVTLHPRDGQDKWEIEAHSTINSEVVKDVFDAVVVANGHYSVPFIPDAKNIKEFQKAYPGAIIHSKQYRKAQAYKDKKVVVVGNGPSGLDLALQISETCKGKPLVSVRHPTLPERLAHANSDEVGEIDEFLIDQRGIRFKDGRVETDIDVIVYCTGFLFSFPFLPDMERKLVSNGGGVHGTYKHIFLVQHPTLAFPGLNMKAAPWPVSEAQAAVFSAVWSNRLQLPPTDEMEAWSKELDRQQGDALHHFGPLGDAYYLNELHDWVMMATEVGKEPPRWNDELMWQRQIFIEAKTTFEKLGCKAKTLEELGYRYEPKKQDQL